MSSVKILMSNIAYGRGLSGSFSDQVLRAYRHVYCRRQVQQGVVEAVRELVNAEKPDVCGFVEIDRGRAAGRAFSQLHAILDERYPHWDIANKYFRGAKSHLVPFLGRNCNAFCARRALPFERVYLASGIKRLVYKISLSARLTLFFTHFSLRRKIRAQQFQDLRAVLDATPGEHVVMGDFNIFGGLAEIGPFMKGSDLVLLNDLEETTHRFHRLHRVLDLCFCSKRLRPKASVRVVEQGYSDHAALVLRLEGMRVRAPEEVG
jgi:endonuclease/exonuclease/phosphatase family metal-dependent hydrolase